MKNILFIITSLEAGGAEKSIVSLLNSIRKDRYNIDLILLKKAGIFMEQIPNNVKIIDLPFPFGCLGVSAKNVPYYLSHNIQWYIKKIKRSITARYNRKLHFQQALWQQWMNDIPMLQKEYDVAISYIEGICNYYVIDKVFAQKKILWIHNEYDKLCYNKVYDNNYFQKANYIVTVSENCANNLKINFPKLSTKIKIIENISNPDLILSMSKEVVQNKLFTESSGYKILSVGRLSPQKGYDLSLQSAKILKEQGVNFKWYIIGIGALLTDLLDYSKALGLTENIIFLGLQSNPYKYMAKADIIVQTSKFEGQSIAIDEAKILCKPIVITNYVTAKDVIDNNINGVIADMNPESIALNIIRVLENKDIQDKFKSNLRRQNIDNTHILNNFYSLIQ